MKSAVILIFLVGVAFAGCVDHGDCEGCTEDPSCGWFAPATANGTAGDWRCVDGAEFTCAQCTGDAFFYLYDHCPDRVLPSLIQHRRAIRAYQPDRLSHAVLHELIRLGTWAPTAMHVEPWRWVVVQDQTLLRNISSAIFPATPEKLFYRAPAVIFAFVEKPAEAMGDLDCALALQNVMLAAHSLGLATCPIGYTRVIADYIAKALAVPATYNYCIALTIGHPAMAATSTRNAPVITWID